MERKPHDTRSVSQLEKYLQCPYRYYLQYRCWVWQRPAAWTAQGNAVHEAVESWERSGRTASMEETQEVFKTAYEKHINHARDETPNLQWWFSSGPKYPGGVDTERRFGLGLEQVRRYVDYYTRHSDETVWHTPSGHPAIELEFLQRFGDVEVRGYVDAVIEHPTLGLVIRDTKTGKKPGGGLQLAVYARALEKQYDVTITTGDYWMGQSGKPTFSYPLHEWTEEVLTETFAWLDENVKAENFTPNPDPSTCRMCPVATACPFFMPQG